MPLGTSVAILEDNKILLTKREDFEVWCLPGGGVDPNETVPQAAIREAKEETGLTIQLTHMVGLYDRSVGNRVSHNILFAARAIDGTLKPQVSEVTDIAYFTRDEALKLPLFADHAQRIVDALDDVGGSVAWWHNTPWPFENIQTRKEVYVLRDQSDLSRQDFYLKHFGQQPLGQGKKLVPPNETP